MIEFKNISFGYHENEEIIHNISFQIQNGKYTTIVGHNGSGKSTLAKLMIGLIEANQGKIIVNQLEVNEKNIDKIRSDVGIVFQNPDNQFIGTSVEDDIAFTLENACIPQNEMQEIIEKYADKVGMKAYLNHEPEKLSGGQKQRVAIAGVLAGQSKIIIFDEATSMLDPKGKKEVLELIKELHQEKDLTIISITHDMEEVLYSDHVIVLEKGEIVLSDIPEVLFENSEKLKNLKLKLPFVLEVVDEARKLGLQVEEHLELEKVVDSLCR